MVTSSYNFKPKLASSHALHTCDEALFYFKFNVIFQFEFIYATIEGVFPIWTRFFFFFWFQNTPISLGLSRDTTKG